MESSVELQNEFRNFGRDEQKSVLLIVVDAQQTHHILFLRQIIDDEQNIYNVDTRNQQKYFVMLVHSPARQLYHQSCFNSIFLNGWDFYFFDTCMSGSSFHVQKMLKILSPVSEEQNELKVDNILLDLNASFNDCLWDFCSKLQLLIQELPEEMFNDKLAYQFYRRQVSVIKRVHCLTKLLEKSSELPKYIIKMYDEYLSKQKKSRHQIYEMIYRISKEIVCGKRFDGLVESVHSYTRIAFISFVSNILKIVINNYGLDTLSKLSKNECGFGSLFYLIDCSSFILADENANILTSPYNHEIFQIVTQYSCIPQTPLYYLLHQRIKMHVDEIKLKHISRLNEHKGSYIFSYTI